MSTGRIELDRKAERPTIGFMLVSKRRYALEQAIVSAVKKWAKLRFQPHFGGMVLLENDMQEAVRALLELESLQEKKD